MLKCGKEASPIMSHSHEESVGHLAVDHKLNTQLRGMARHELNTWGEDHLSLDMQEYPTFTDALYGIYGALGTIAIQAVAREVEGG